MSPEKRYTYSEFVSTFLPKLILTRMEEQLMELQGLKFSWQHRLYTDENDPRKGFVEVAKVTGFHSGGITQDWLKDFYKSEGYQVKKEDETLIVSIKEDQFRVSVNEFDTNFMVNVSGL